MFIHQPSGLYLTKYRAYDPYSGRWLSRDPSGEVAGINLYGYVGQDPTNYEDTFGLCKTCTGIAQYSAVGPTQALGRGALGINPPMGSVAVSPAAFGLPYTTIAQRVSSQAILEQAMGSMRITASGLNMAGGPQSQTFTVGDVGDANIRGANGTRFDIYRFDTQADALSFGERSANTVISNVPDNLNCPPGFEEQR